MILQAIHIYKEQRWSRVLVQPVSTSIWFVSSQLLGLLKHTNSIVFFSLRIRSVFSFPVILGCVRLLQPTQYKERDCMTYKAGSQETLQLLLFWRGSLLWNMPFLARVRQSWAGVLLHRPSFMKRPSVYTLWNGNSWANILSHSKQVSVVTISCQTSKQHINGHITT